MRRRALLPGCGWCGPPQGSVPSPPSRVHLPRPENESALIFLMAHEGFFDLDAYAGTVFVRPGPGDLYLSCSSLGTRVPPTANFDQQI